MPSKMLSKILSLDSTTKNLFQIKSILTTQLLSQTSKPNMMLYINSTLMHPLLIPTNKQSKYLLNLQKSFLPILSISNTLLTPLSHALPNNSLFQLLYLFLIILNALMSVSPVSHLYLLRKQSFLNILTRFSFNIMPHKMQSNCSILVAQVLMKIYNS